MSSLRPTSRTAASAAGNLGRRLVFLAVAASIHACATPADQTDQAPPDVAALAGGVESANISTGAPAGQDAMRLGDRMREGGDLASASRFYRQAARLAPENPEPLERLADTLFREGEYFRAAGSYRALLTLRPDDTQAKTGLARSLVATGNPQGALDLLDRLNDGGSEPLDVTVARGVALDMLGRHEEAQSIYNSALRTAPRDLRLKTNLALSTALSGRPEEAARQMQLVASDPFADTRHLRDLVLLLAAAGREADAMRASERLPTEDARGLLQLGQELRARIAAADPYSPPKLGVIFIE